MYIARGAVSLILACIPALEDDITAAPSYACPRMLDGSKEIDVSETDSKIVLQIVLAFAFSRYTKLIRHFLICGSRG